MTILLTACSSVGNIFGSSEDPPLPGDRISVLELQSELEPDDVSLEAQGFVAPDAWQNEFWPQRGGYPNHSMQNLALNAGELQRAWSTSIGRKGTDRMPLTAQPIVVNGRVFTLDSESSVAAFNVEDGNEVWRIETSPDDEDEAAISGGISFGDGVLFATTGFGEILAINQQDGSIYWRKRLPSPARAAPTILNGQVYVQLLENALLAMDLKTGGILWRYNAFSEASGFIGAASPAAAPNLVVAAFSSGEITGLNPENGAVLWSDTLAPRRRLGGMSSVSDVTALPVIDRDLVFGVGFGGRMTAINVEQGLRVWQREIGGTETPWVAGNHIFVITRENELAAIGRESGKVRWILDLALVSEDNDTEYWTGPVLGGGRLFIASSEGMIAEIAPQDGQLLRTFKAPGSVSLSPLIAGGTLYTLSDNGQLAAYR